MKRYLTAHSRNNTCNVAHGQTSSMTIHSLLRPDLIAVKSSQVKPRFLPFFSIQPTFYLSFEKKKTILFYERRYFFLK